MSDIKGIILDIDGCIVGEKVGYNSPWPNEEVIERLKNIRKKGIPISLCTAKPAFAIEKIIQDCKLDNYHITDGGGVIINPVKKEIVNQYVIDKEKVKKVLKMCLDNNVYVEIYTTEHYYIQKSQENEITTKHKHILQNEVVLLDDIITESEKYDITKIMPISINETEDKERITKMFNELNIDLTLSWGIHPIANPLRFGIITEKGISKKEGAITIAESINVPFKNILSIGDSTSDWQFISLTGFCGVMQNASDELKRLASEKDNFIIGGHVDENGILKIFDYYNL